MSQSDGSLLAPEQRMLWSEGMPLQDRIQYACGRNAWDGWTNTDFFDAHSYPTGEFPEELIGRVYHVDLASRHPFPSDSFEYAYTEDFIEHLSQKDAITFLFEARRCLKPGGVLRVSTPGIQGVMFRHYYDRQFEDLAQEHYQCFDRWGHIHLFSHDTLRAVALAVGFSRYEEVVFGRSKHEILNGIDTRAEQIDFNIIAELTK
ncbi:MAG: methyltransferase domain-containing protein [Caulobacterales bacterium]|nr:methyltransferase domain-containing protein [Caulobacterales bacterium]